jgi:hypothetical protein
MPNRLWKLIVYIVLMFNGWVISLIEEIVCFVILNEREESPYINWQLK